MGQGPIINVKFVPLFAHWYKSHSSLAVSTGQRPLPVLYQACTRGECGIFSKFYRDLKMVVARGVIAFGILVAILDPARSTSLYSNDRQGVNDCCSGCNSSTSHFGYTEATCHGRSSSVCVCRGGS